MKTTFSLSEEQEKKYTDWKELQEEKSSERTVEGGRFSLIFTQTGIGDIVLAFDNILEEEYDLTEYEHFN
jgi:predicted tellurium resistance membrane protein TerC